MKTHPLKRAIQLLGLLILLHVIAMLAFGLFFSQSIAYMSEDAPTQANLTILIFNVVVDIIFIAIFSKIETSFVDFRRNLKDNLKEPNFSLIKYWKENHFRDNLIIIILMIVLQIPFAIFYSIWGMSLQYTTMFEQFYIIDAGSYLITSSAIVGILLNTVIFGIIYFAVKFLFLLIAKKDVEKDIV